MNARPVSVAVVSHGRPAALSLCLTALTQLDYHPFEIVVVADKAGLRRLDLRPDLFGRIKRVRCDTPNISRARNMAIRQAAGEIVAFIDDDAAAEAQWLRHLAAAFDDPEAAAATGYVRGRNGISFQHRVSDIAPDGTSRPVDLDVEGPLLLRPGDGRGIKTEGTNMAFRRGLLAELGGFDPAYQFYLDESDLNMRLARRAACTAVVPLAQVHHGLAAGRWRRDDRVPLSLHEVGASLAVFLRRHAAGIDPARFGRRERQARRRGLLEHMVAGRIEPRDVRRLLATFDAGWAEGLERRLEMLPPLGEPESEFLPFRPLIRPAGHRVLAGRSWQAKRRRGEARKLVARGFRVSLFLFGPTARYHRVRFTSDGVWEQTGGLFGRSERSQPLWRWHRFRARLADEAERVERVRQPPGSVSGPDRVAKG